MNERTLRRSGGSGVNVVLGIWLIISPFVLSFTPNLAAKWNDIAVGAAVALLALSGARYWNFVLGIWLIISPAVLDFANAPTPLWNNVFLGALVFIVAVLSRPAPPVAQGRPPPG